MFRAQIFFYFLCVHSSKHTVGALFDPNMVWQTYRACKQRDDVTVRLFFPCRAFFVCAIELFPLHRGHTQACPSMYLSPWMSQPAIRELSDFDCTTISFLAWRMQLHACMYELSCETTPNKLEYHVICIQV